MCRRHKTHKEWGWRREHGSILFCVHAAPVCAIRRTSVGLHIRQMTVVADLIGSVVTAYQQVWNRSTFEPCASS